MIRIAMTDPTLARQYRPIEEETSGASAVLRFLFAAALVVDAALVAFPDLIRIVAPDWRGDPNQVRLVAFGVLFACLTISGVRGQRRRGLARRAAFSQFAAAVGSQVVEAPYRVTVGGWEGGPRVAYRVSGWPATLETDRGSDSNFTHRLAADAVLRRDFQLLILPGGKVMRALLSGKLLGPVLTLAGKASASSRPQGASTRVPEPAAEELFARLRFAGGDAITTGDEPFDRKFLVKASDASLARSLASDAAVRSALLALRERASAFQVSLESAAGAGPARLMVRTTLADPTADTFGAMDALLRAALAGLHRLDLLEPGARGAA